MVFVRGMVFFLGGGWVGRDVVGWWVGVGGGVELGLVGAGWLHGVEVLGCLWLGLFLVVASGLVGVGWGP